MMKCFAIKKPAMDVEDEVIWWFGIDAPNAWRAFFGEHAHQFPLDEAIRAYKSIGYKCVEVEVKEI